MYGPGNFMQIFGFFWASLTGFVFFLIWVAVLLLLVRFLLIGTRAAKLYLRSNGEHDGLLPQRATSATTPAPAAPATTTPATKPAPRPRTPKVP